MLRSVYSIFVMLVCITSFCDGQDISNFTQFYINPYTLNPSYAGVEGQTALFLGYRKQWASIEGGPAIGNFSAHTPLNKNLGLGFSATNDKRGITQVSGALLSVSYTATIDNATSIRFGLSAGMGFNTVDAAILATYNDPAITSLLSNNSSLLGNAGISFHKKTFHIGVALPNIFEPMYLSKDAFTVSPTKPFQSIVLHASNRFYFNKDKNVFEPYLIYRMNGSLPPQIEAAAIVHLQHTVWVGASYKQQFGISALLGFKIKNQFGIGLSYTVQNMGENQIASPSYELQMGYLLGNKKKGSENYSFVDTHKEKLKKPPVNAVASRKQAQRNLDKRLQEDRKRQEAALARAKNLPSASANLTHQPRFKAKQDLLADKPIAVDTAKVPAKAAPPSPPVDAATAKAHAEERKVLDQHLDDHAEGKHDDAHQSTVNQRHDFVKRGTHHEELEAATYVIAGAFQSRANAEHYVAKLKTMGFKPDFGHLSVRNLWYVFVSEEQAIPVARQERDALQKNKIFKDVWLLTVQE